MQRARGRWQSPHGWDKCLEQHTHSGEAASASWEAQHAQSLSERGSCNTSGPGRPSPHPTAAANNAKTPGSKQKSVYCKRLRRIRRDFQPPGEKNRGVKNDPSL